MERDEPYNNCSLTRVLGQTYFGLRNSMGGCSVGYVGSLRVLLVVDIVIDSCYRTSSPGFFCADTERKLRCHVLSIGVNMLYTSCTINRCEYVLHIEIVAILFC